MVGGGDVAMDAARTALRAADYAGGAASGGAADDDGRRNARCASITEALDVARSAARAGAREITVISLESREEMPAHEFEIEEAAEEGIAFLHRRGPADASSPRAAGSSASRPSGSRRCSTTTVASPPSSTTTTSRSLEADTVILAIGQAIDLEALGADGPEISPRRTIAVDPDTGATSHRRRLVGRATPPRGPGP